jgi:hypothetical protein
MSTPFATPFVPRPRVSLLYAAGLVLLFLGERVLGAGTGRGVLSGLGLALVAGALAWRTVRWRRARGEARVLEQWRLGLFLLGVLGLGLYFPASDVGAVLLSAPLKQQAPRLAGVLLTLFPALLTTALLPLALVELAASAMARAPVLELGRARAALHSGLGLAFVLIFAFSAQYVATRADTAWDLSYFRTARPGDATRKLVRGLNAPVQATLFFPPASDVGQAVEQYFRDLAPESGQLRVEVLDQAVDPARARALGVSTNGTLVLSRGERRESFTLLLDMDRARGQLQRLDQEVYRRLRVVARPRRVLYLTTGHGERGTQAREATAVEEARPALQLLVELLRSQNVEVRPLGLAEGLGSAVPKEASLVAVVGPTRDFLPEELASLRAYVERGGRLWLALEPEGARLEALLSPLGLKVLPGGLANDQSHLSLNRQQSDRAFLTTASFSSHASVGTLASLGTQAPAAFLGAAALESVQPLPTDLTLEVAVRADAATFQDLDGDFAPGAEEPRRPWPLVVAVERAGGPWRVVVMGDADALGDELLRNLGNAYLALDALRWLTGEEALGGTVSFEEDVPLQHTRRQDVAWFYSAIFLVPALVLGLGFLVTRKRGRLQGKAAEP